MLQVQSLSHQFDILLYEDVNFSLSPGQTLAILGVSGSGKSTILNHLSTMLKPNHGQIDLLGHQNIYSLPDAKLLEIRRYEIGIIFQAHYLFRGFSARENLKIANLLTQNTLDSSVLESFKIDSILDQGVGTLSGGQQQRVSIARVLSKNPKIIFADEPTGNLDGDTARSVMRVLFDYVRTNAAMLVLATHDEALAFDCDFVYRLKDKRLKQEK
ncbi:ABC transporter ATP-binding protein [Helicobacter mustelae]|uniref:Putative ABC transporter ATP binding protein n=1 Tax=Helicobacter mustelae (strain ATCC 43772 / CCUG 25715 / CIP 103759 / LMG 18044 / NCTC 12198 / R85-136P) TaxID=679897 RepID=D3UIP6_HELM1|nr:ATP-binding cassette domain-containing protein [Helicobacter mustelae]CBG40371.1 putative ABC transporter ATP binding protein [Helicobacter mustelae 12198]SQH71870.1 ABC transporter ATP-binding protein [Helicobacter mustelae]STP13009.1 ABC transporter ATP-binding protein [Helicobacter mustelae]